MTIPLANLGYDHVVLKDKEFAAIGHWVYEVAGIRIGDNKKALVASRLSIRLRELNLSSYQQYFDIISSIKDPRAVTERQKAINLLTTNETFFFREEAHFDFLRDVILPLKCGNKVRCWSAASSTGEEAYTLAMMLATYHRASWEIVGTDINDDVVSRATRGIYQLQRADHIPKSFLYQFCLKGTGAKAGTFRISSELRQHVTFMNANLQQLPNNLGKFDVIFLRNVMIYFDIPSKIRVVENVVRHLKPGGYLIIGHAESLNGITDCLTMLRPSIYILS